MLIVAGKAYAVNGAVREEFTTTTSRTGKVNLLKSEAMCVGTCLTALAINLG